MKKVLFLLFLASFILSLSACNTKSTSNESEVFQSSESNRLKQPILWLIKKSSVDTTSSELYAKFGSEEIEKIAGDVITGSHVTYGNGQRILFLNNEFELYYIEEGKEKEKVGSDVQEYSYKFSQDGKSIFYLTTDNELYMKNDDEDRTKLASDVYEFTHSTDNRSIYYLNSEGNLSSISLKDEMETSIASEVVSYIVSKNGLLFTNNDGMLYKVDNKGEKLKISKMEVVSPAISHDSTQITYLEEYNYEKGYGELFVQTKNDERIKVASDVTTQTISADGKKIYFINSDNNFYLYHIDSKEKLKLASDVMEYREKDNLSLYLTNEQTLYAQTKDGDSKKITADAKDFGIINNETIYYLTKDKELYLIINGDKKKVVSDIESLYVSSDYLYYLTKDSKIGVLPINENKPKVLLDDFNNYSIIYTESYILYQKQLKLTNLKGYWFNASNDFFISIDEIKDDSAQMGYYTSYYEDIQTIYPSYLAENSISFSNDSDDMEIKLINPKTIELTYNSTDTYTLIKSNENTLSKMRTKNGANNYDKRISEESVESYEDTTQIEDLVTNYSNLLIDAINYNDFSLVEPTLVNGSNLYNMQKDLVQNLNKKGITEDVYSFKILDVTKIKDGEYKVKTFEEANVYYADGTSELVSYNWTYTIVDNEEQFGLTDIEKSE